MSLSCQVPLKSRFAQHVFALVAGLSELITFRLNLTSNLSKTAQQDVKDGLIDGTGVVKQISSMRDTALGC